MFIDEKDLRSACRNGTLKGIYFLWGDEDYLKRIYIKNMKKSVVGEDDFSDMNSFSFFWGDSDDITGDVADALMAPVLFGERKFISIRIASYDSIKEKELLPFLELLKDYSDDESTVTAISVFKDGFDAPDPKKRKNNAKLDALNKYMTCVYVGLSSDRDLFNWMRKHFAQYDVFADDGVLRKICDLAGKEMCVLSGEIDKLAAYVSQSGRNTATMDDVINCISRNDESDDFGMSNAILYGNTYEALYDLQQKIRAREEPLYVLGQISRSFSSIALARAFIDEGRSLEEFKNEAKLNERIAPAYFRSARDVSARWIAEVMKLCAETDKLLKSGVKSSNDYTPIERLICTVSRGRHD